MTEPQTADRISAGLWTTFVVCLLGNIFAGIVSTIMPVYLPVIVRSLTHYTSDEQLGNVSALISSLYLVGWAIGGLVWGFISDKIGRAKSLVIAISMYSSFTLVISFSSSWEMIVLFRLLSGFAVGGLMVITPTLLSEIWPAKTRAVVLGIDSIGFPIGIFSSGVVTYLVSDWRQGFLVAITPLVLAIAALWIVKESDGWRQNDGHKIHEVRFGTEDKKNVLRGSVIFGTMLIGLWALFSWIPTWEQSILVGSDGQTERGLTMMTLGSGGLIGGFISGWVANFIGVRRAMLICYAGCFTMSLILFGLNATFDPSIYFEVFLLALFFGMSQGLLSIYITQLFRISIRATATGFCFNAGRFVTAGAIFFVGTLVSLAGGYGNALLLFSIVFAVGFVTIYFSKQKSIQSLPA